MLKRVLLGLVAAVMLAGLAHAGALEDGRTVYMRGNYAEALKQYRLAAEQGVGPAQCMLGSIYYLGEDVPEDDAEAAKWYRLAAEQGHAGSQDMLGTMYTDGRGVPQDFVLAHMWFNLASANGHKFAAMNRDGLAKRAMTPDQIAEAQRLAREWQAKHKR